ncbi:MAG: murein biosynthesis integral membrane protein MurJ [Deltaproteobacteria bacterium]|nr:murein biosynthesis integral membrane protein MurJ [Deltaproteobacteria bacterium]
MKRLSVQGIAEATVIIAIARALAGFLKLLVIVFIAREFGAGLIVDAYMVAKSVPMLFFVIGEATFVTSFLPVFVNYRVKEGENQAWLLSDSVFSFLLLFLTAVVACVVFFAPGLTFALAPGLPEETLSLGASLVRMMSPVIVLAGASSMAASIFNSYRNFTIPAVASVLFPLGIIIAVWLFADVIGIYAIPLGAVAGAVAQAGITIAVLGKTKRWLRPTLHFQCSGFFETVRSTVPRLLTLVVNRANIMVDRVFASALGGGYIAALSYADRVVQISVVLFTSSFANAAMPVLSKSGASGDFDRVRRLFHKMTGFLFFVTMPASIILILFGKTITTLLLQRGAFDVDAVILTSSAMMFYGFGLLPFAMTMLLGVFFYALSDSMTPMKAAFVCFFLNVGLDALLVRFLELGGLALTTSLVAIFSTVFLFWFLNKKIGPLDLRRIMASFGKTLTSACLMGVIMWGVMVYFERSNAQPGLWLQLGGSLCLGFVGYAGICCLFKVDECRVIVDAVCRRFQPRHR